MHILTHIYVMDLVYEQFWFTYKWYVLELKKKNSSMLLIIAKEKYL